MKRFCLINFCNMYTTPYAKIYINLIKENGGQCEILYWDRDAEHVDNDGCEGCKKHFFRFEITPETGKKDKVKGYILATKYFIKILKEEKYDALIFLQTHAAIACRSILNAYNKRYVIDIRDYTLEKYWLYRKLEKQVIGDAYLTIISSPAYKKFLPSNNYIIAHNMASFNNEEINRIREHKWEKKSPINISFIGSIRFIDMDIKILNFFSKDSRFHLNYFGLGSDVLENYCHSHKIKNVSFCGRFAPSDTAKLYENTDIINNLYGYGTPYLDYALSNKLYHAGQFHIPILVFKGTYMEEVTLKYGMGIAVSLDADSERNEIYNWFYGLNRNQFAQNCDRFISKVNYENDRYKSAIKDFINYI